MPHIWQKRFEKHVSDSDVTGTQHLLQSVAKTTHYGIGQKN
jgi:hypothetical protein